MEWVKTFADSVTNIMKKEGAWNYSKSKNSWLLSKVKAAKPSCATINCPKSQDMNSKSVRVIWESLLQGNLLTSLANPISLEIILTIILIWKSLSQIETHIKTLELKCLHLHHLILTFKEEEFLMITFRAMLQLKQIIIRFLIWLKLERTIWINLTQDIKEKNRIKLIYWEVLTKFSKNKSWRTSWWSHKPRKRISWEVARAEKKNL